MIMHDHVTPAERLNFNSIAEVQQIKEWVQRKIDYWEDTCEKTKVSGYEEGEDDGMLAAFYMVREFIDGQRR